MNAYREESMALILELKELMESKNCKLSLRHICPSSLDAESDFWLFDRYSRNLQTEFGKLTQYVRYQGGNYPELCRGREIASPTLDGHLHQAPFYHSVGDATLRNRDKRAVDSQDTDNATPLRRLRFLWRWWSILRRKELHGFLERVLSSEDRAVRPPILPNAEYPLVWRGKPDRLQQQGPIFKLPKSEEKSEAHQIVQPKQKAEARCAKCTQILECGEFQSSMVRLRQLRFCEACNERHAGIFFPRESIEGGNKNLACIGKLGRVTLCSHMEPTTWESIHEIDESCGISGKVKCHVCTHPTHRWCSRSEPTTYDYSFPRMYAQLWVVPWEVQSTIQLGWDLPLLDIDSKDPPSTAVIRSTLQNLIVNGALGNHKACPHMADGKLLCQFAVAGICDCFTMPETSIIPDAEAFSGPPCYSSHPRQQYLVCEDCGAFYTWALTSGRITLVYRYSWDVFKPTSPAWLNVLDDLPALAGIFHDKNKHIFWCDSPGCATGKDIRLWQDMVKEEMGLHHERYEDIAEQSCDWFVHLRRSKKKGRMVRLPPRVAGAQRSQFLREVREAAKSEVGIVQARGE